MVRTGEGFVQRIDTMLEYEKEIDTFDDAVLSQENAPEKELGEGFLRQMR